MSHSPDRGGDRPLDSLALTLGLVYGLGYLGYRGFKYFNLPAAGLVGAMFATAVVAVLGFPWGPIPPMVNVVLQAVVGVMIGSKIGRETVTILRSLILPALLVAAWMVGTGALVGLVLSTLTSLDLATSIFSAAPGGIAEMSIIALDYGADVSAVALLQFIRILGTYATVPLISRRFSRSADPSEVRLSPPRGMGGAKASRAHPLALTLAIGLAGGYLAWWAGIPAGGIVGSMVAVGVLQTGGMRLRGLPSSGVIAAQIGLGGILGLNFDPTMLAQLTAMIVPVLLLTALLLLSGIILGFLLHRFFGWDLTTSLLACAAAGLTQMGTIALEMDADPVRVSLLHLVRIVAIIIFLPPLIALIVG